MGAPRLELSESDLGMVDGREGAAAQLGMRFIVRAAEATGATHLVDVSSAHVIGGFYSGEVGIDFAQRMVDLGATVRVPTTLTASSIALSQPHLSQLDPHEAAARQLADLYLQLGAEPAWTCAPYHLPNRPRPGQDIAWGESGAVAFANSALGARTNKYGEPLDIAAAICGRVPASGLHLPEERAARIVFEVGEIDPRLLADDSTYQALGYLIGDRARALVPAVTGLPQSLTDEQMVALVAAAASSGGVALLHVVGVTPEAETLDAALQGRAPERLVCVGPAELALARRALSTARRDQPLGAVSVGTPHLSLREIDRLVALLDGRRIAGGMRFYAATCRFVAEAAAARGQLEELEAAGVTLVLDTCTYFGKVVDYGDGAVMTNSAKWAHYGPALTGAPVVFGSLGECVESAVAGSIWTDPELSRCDGWS